MPIIVEQSCAWLAALSFFTSVLHALRFVNLLSSILAWTAIDILKDLMMWIPFLCGLNHTWDLKRSIIPLLLSLARELSSPPQDFF